MSGRPSLYGQQGYLASRKCRPIISSDYGGTTLLPGAAYFPLEARQHSVPRCLAMPTYRSHEQLDPFLGHRGPPEASGFAYPSLVFELGLEKSVPLSGPTHLQRHNTHVNAHFSPYQIESLMSRHLADTLHIPLSLRPVEKTIYVPNAASPAGIEPAEIVCHVVTLNSVVIFEDPVWDRTPRSFSNPQTITFLVLDNSSLEKHCRLPDSYVCLGFKFIAQHFQFPIAFTKRGGRREYSLKAIDTAFCATPLTAIVAH
jgi:hypothetical protein